MPAINEYIKQYTAQFNYAPSLNSLNVYSAIQILSDAVRAGNSNSNEIKAYILKKRVFTTDFGVIRFNKFGDSLGRLYFITDIEDEFK